MAGERTLIGPVSGLSNAFEKSAVQRCPGASNTYPPADESAPFTDGGRVACDPKLGIEQP
jgi:hypothetical protein